MSNSPLQHVTKAMPTESTPSSFTTQHLIFCFPAVLSSLILFISFFPGWDETVLFWDLRVPQKENPVNYLYGPLICGEALDVNDNYILTGSWREKQQLEIWDMRKLQLVKSLEWIPQKKDEKSYIYSAQFSKFSQNYIIAGSSGASEIRIFHLRNEEHCGD